MVPEDVRGKFEMYRKWFYTFLRKEFFNLPADYQKRFFTLNENFISDCKNIHEEHQLIKEKVLEIRITKVLDADNKEENFIVFGTVLEDGQETKISYPAALKRPKAGDTIHYTVYSLDGNEWYSSKEELIKERGQKDGANKNSH